MFFLNGLKTLLRTKASAGTGHQLENFSYDLGDLSDDEVDIDVLP